jgi:ABC-type transporter MlaC component
MSHKFSYLKALFTQLTPSQRESFIKMIEAYLDCRYKDFHDIVEQMKWDRAYEGERKDENA